LNVEPGWRWPLRGEVEVALRVGAARRHRADEAVARVDRDDGRRRVTGLIELALDSGARDLLELGVDRRVDP